MSRRCRASKTSCVSREIPSRQVSIAWEDLTKDIRLGNLSLSDVVMTRSRKTNLTPAARFCAAMSLAGWLAALVFCSADCLIGDCQCQPGHDEQATFSHHDNDHTPDSDGQDGHHDSFCDSLKSVVHTTGRSVLSKSDFGVAFTLSFVAHSQALTIAEIEVPVSRQPPDRNWVFRPEVSLGPAFRAHAPPVLL